MFGLNYLDFQNIALGIAGITALIGMIYRGDHGKIIFCSLILLIIGSFSISIYLYNDIENKVPNRGMLRVFSNENLMSEKSGGDLTIVYDTETKVMYLYGGKNSSAVTPLYNADGSLRLYQEK